MSTITAHPPIPIWPGKAPGALGDQPADMPTLTSFFPEPAHRSGASMLVLPGGGYAALAEHEGAGYARWLAAHGIAAHVLAYRLGPNGYRHPVMLQDAARGLRTVRARARRDGLDPARIGIIGSSAGGHLAATLMTHFDPGQASAADAIERESSRPDFGILCYPVITMLDGNVHAGSRENLLGKRPSPRQLRELSNELQVTASTPPCFVWHTCEDAAVKVENSLDFAAALRRAGVPFDLHIYERGAHGLGLGDPAAPHPWAADCLFWLRQRGAAR